jgi:hypothetical protein
MLLLMYIMLNIIYSHNIYYNIIYVEWPHISCHNLSRGILSLCCGDPYLSAQSQKANRYGDVWVWTWH